MAAPESPEIVGAAYDVVSVEDSEWRPSTVDLRPSVTEKRSDCDVSDRSRPPSPIAHPFLLTHVAHALHSHVARVDQQAHLTRASRQAKHMPRDRALPVVGARQSRGPRLLRPLRARPGRGPVLRALRFDRPQDALRDLHQGVLWMRGMCTSSSARSACQVPDRRPSRQQVRSQRMPRRGAPRARGHSDL